MIKAPFLLSILLATNSCHSPSGKLPQGFAVIELYTSEGCSSCPVADDILAKIQQEYAGKRVYPLSFHVDYWDRLGWKDPFSNAAYSSRQRQYDDEFKSSVFTPQVVLNGKEEIPGYREKEITEFIQQNIAEPATSLLSLKASADQHQVVVHFSINHFMLQDYVQLLLVQLSATDQVKAGENNGRTLHHVDIVREMFTLSQANGEQQFSIPDNLTANDIKIVVLLQKGNGEILDANSCEVSQ